MTTARADQGSPGSLRSAGKVKSSFTFTMPGIEQSVLKFSA